MKNDIRSILEKYDTYYQSGDDEFKKYRVNEISKKCRNGIFSSAEKKSGKWVIDETDFLNNVERSFRENKLTEEEIFEDAEKEKKKKRLDAVVSELREKNASVIRERKAGIIIVRIAFLFFVFFYYAVGTSFNPFWKYNYYFAGAIFVIPIIAFFSAIIFEEYKYSGRVSFAILLATSVFFISLSSSDYDSWSYELKEFNQRNSCKQSIKRNTQDCVQEYLQERYYRQYD